MKSSLRLLFPGLALLLVFALVARSQDKAGFLKAFRQAMQIGDSKLMQKLVRTRVDDAVAVIVQHCEDVVEKPSDQLEEEIAALRKAWKAAMKTGFVSNEYEYFQLMRPEVRRQRRQLRQQYRLYYGQYEQAIAKKDAGALGELSAHFEGLARAFEEIGDYYQAGQSWLVSALCNEEKNRGKDADLKRACSAYGGLIATREKVELADSFYHQAKARFDDLEYQGYGDPSKGPEARKKAKEAAESANSFTVTTRFELFPELNAVRRPLYTADEAYQVWTGLYLKGKDSEAVFNEINAVKGTKSPRIRRTGALQALVDGDGDGEPETEIPLSGKVTPVTIKLGSGEAEREWGFLATIGTEQDTYQKIKFNLGPSDENLTIYIAPAASVVGMIGDTPIRILDDNLDGIYGSFPLSWGNIGTLEGHYQTDFDSIVIGKSKVALPWSEVQKVGDQWYRIKSLDGGTKLEVTPTTVETGKLRLVFKGGKVDYLVVKGELASNENYYFDVAANKGGIEVPVGRYVLVCGRISKGKRAEIMKAMIVPGVRTPSWNVEPGETTTIELGAPFGFDFDVVQDEETVKVIGSSVVVTGKAHEIYQRMWNCVVSPTVYVRPVGKKKGSDEGDMRSAESQEQVVDDLGGDFKTLWFPIDFEARKKKSGDAEVRLVEKKNKLFGKIESDWKG